MEVLRLKRDTVSCEGNGLILNESTLKQGIKSFGKMQDSNDFESNNFCGVEHYEVEVCKKDTNNNNQVTDEYKILKSNLLKEKSEQKINKKHYKDTYRTKSTLRNTEKDMNKQLPTNAINSINGLNDNNPSANPYIKTNQQNPTIDQLKKRIRRNNKVENQSNGNDESLIKCSCVKGIDFKEKKAGDEMYNIKDDDYEVSSPGGNSKSRNIQPHKLISLNERNGGTICNKHMPWFGIDVGGTLVKVVFFDPKDATSEELITLNPIRCYLKSPKPYGTSGKRDAHLEMPNCVINKRAGTLHFIRFATNRMPAFLTMAKNKKFVDTIHTVCATGGGAYKFEDDIKRNLGITLHKTDELDSIIYGIHYIDKYNSDRECYFLDNPLDDEKCVKVPYDFSRPYPYLVVNIGSGVSILAVYSSTSYSRISGSSIGGGTFLGLCCLLTQCKTFDEAIRLAKAGSSAKIDKLVKDIYGGDYPKFNLSGDTVASSFGHMNMTDIRKDVKREDLARALLEMVTINIGSIARMCAENEDIDRVVFIGNFLRVNQLSMKLLSYAVNYWSRGAMKALFLEHEGYFGAVGCFVESTQGCQYS